MTGTTERPTATPRASVCVCGAGNIGSALLGHVARIERVREISVFDHEVYEPGNVLAQLIDPRDVGTRKARVQRDRLARLREDLEVIDVARRVEEVPWGRFLGCDVIVSALDSRASRLYLGELAWRLSIPFLDGGVEARQGLARVSLFAPDDDGPCPFCDLGDDELASLPGRMPCGGTVAAPTRAPSYLGAAAGVLEAQQVALLVDGSIEMAAVGCEAVLDLARLRLTRTRLVRNPDCVFDHQRMGPIEALPLRPGALRLGDLLVADDTWLAVAGQRFVTRLVCEAGHWQRFFRVASRVREAGLPCGRCGASMRIDESGLVHRLDRRIVPRKRLELSLHQLGCEPLDIIEIGSGETVRHYLLGGAEPIPSRGGEGS